MAPAAHRKFDGFGGRPALASVQGDIEPGAGLVGIKPSSDDRLFEPESARARRQASVRLAVAILGASLIHVAVIAPLLVTLGFAPPEPPPEATPVEVVMEEPPPPPPPSPPQEQPPQPLDEKEATEAPKAAQQSDHMKDGASAAAPPPQPPQEVAKPEPQQPPSPPPPAVASAEEAPTPDAPKAVPTPEESPAPSAQPGASPGPLPRIFTLPSFSEGPAFDAAALSQYQAPISGSVEPSYLSTVYAQVMSHMPRGLEESGRGPRGEIDFVVDGQGRLVNRKIVHSSGDKALDKAAFDAIGEAAPYPAPPTHTPVGMVFWFKSS